MKSIAAVTGRLFRYLEVPPSNEWKILWHGLRPREEQATARTSYCNIMLQRIQYQEANNRKNTCNSIDMGKSRAAITTWTSATAGSPSTARTQATAGRPTADNLKINTFSSCGTFSRVPNQFSEDWWFDTNIWAILFFSPQGRNFRWRSPNFQPLST